MGKRRTDGTEFLADAARRRLEDVLGPLPDGVAERVVREVLLVEFRRGKRAGMLDASARVTNYRERWAIRQEARGYEPEDLDEVLRQEGRRRGPPRDPWAG